MVGTQTVRKLAVLVGVAAATLAITVPATPASAQRCNPDLGCSNGIPKRPEGAVGPMSFKTGWVTYVEQAKDGSWWSYSMWTSYQQDRLGHCWDASGVGVGCP